MVDNVLQKVGRIDILVVSGGATSGPEAIFFENIDPALYVEYAKMQWLNRAYCIRAVLDHMIKRRAGKIILLGTDAGRWPTPGESMVGASGAALVMMTKVLAQEFARWQIRINTICLSVVGESPSLELVLSHPAGKIFKKAIERQPFPVTPKDVEAMALFLASDDANQITGQIFALTSDFCGYFFIYGSMKILTLLSSEEACL